MFSVIILSHNRPKLLEKSVRSIINQPINFRNYEIIIVDSSTDKNEFKNLFIKIKNKFKDINIKYFISSKNLDQTQKRNIAVRSSKFKWLIFIDDDAFFKKKSLKKIYEFLLSKKKKINILSGRLLPMLESNRYKNKFLKKRIFLNKFAYYVKDFSILDLGKKKMPIKTDLLFASLFMIRKNIYIKSGGLGPDGYKGNKILLNGSGENNILKYARKKNIEVSYFPDLCAKHFIGNYRFKSEYLKSRNFYYGICSSFNYVRDNSYYMYISYLIKQIILYILIKLSFRKDSTLRITRITGIIYHLIFSIYSSNFRNYCKHKNWYKNKYIKFIKKFSFKTTHNYLSWTQKNK